MADGGKNTKLFGKIWSGNKDHHNPQVITEYLDTLSELLARLDTLQDFAQLCGDRPKSVPKIDTLVKVSFFVEI